jgi:hypothetical protein
VGQRRTHAVIRSGPFALIVMTCEDYRASLDDLLEGGLDAARREALDEHAAGCDPCRALTADLQRIAQVAATLERHAAPRDGWSKLARCLEAEPAFGEARRRATETREAPRGVQHWTWLAAAAVLILAVGVTLVMLRRENGSGPGATPVGSAQPRLAGNAQTNDLVESVEAEMQQAASHFENAISGLEQLANQNDSPLDPEVTTQLRQNLAVIDKAIAESRTALRAQPESQLAQESLFDAFRRKVALLQDTIALMNEMRKGNQAGAARIAAGTDKS